MCKTNKLRIIYSYFSFSTRILIGILFIFSGISKLADIAMFRYAVTVLKLFYSSSRELITFTIPVIEIIIGLLLIIGLFTNFALIHLNVLLAGFAYISIYAINLKLLEPCSCCGPIVDLRYNISHVVFIFILFFLNILGLFDKYKIFTIDRFLKLRKERLKKAQ